MNFDIENMGVALLVVLFLAVSLAMVLVVLIQRPQGGGLSGAFGAGSGGGQSAFGARTGDALTISTIVIFLLFLSVAIALNFILRPPEPVSPSLQPTGGSQQEAPAEGAGTPDDAPLELPAETPGSEDDAAPADPAPAEPAPDGDVPPTDTDG